MLTSSCEKAGQLFPRTPGSRIVFGSSTRRGSSTKVEYSGDVNSATKYERINWLDGDVISIYCKQANMADGSTADPAFRFADYSVETGSVTSSGSSSSARIEPLSGSAFLTWGEEGTMHYFSALYPAPGQGVANEAVKVSENTATCVIPAEQAFYGAAPSYDSKTGKTVAEVNPIYLYLAGYGKARSGDESESEAVSIYFDPAVTTFEFTLVNVFESGNPMTIKRAGITTEDDIYLSGTYDVNVAGINATDGTLRTSDITFDGSDTKSKTLSMNFSPAVSIEKDEEFTFTLFAQPGSDISKLTFWMTDNSDVTRSFKFRYADKNNSKGKDGWVNFTAFHKARITGLMAPEQAGWKINMVPVVVDWEKEFTDIEADEDGNVLAFTTPVVTTWVPEDNGNIPFSE